MAKGYVPKGYGYHHDNYGHNGERDIVSRQWNAQERYNQQQRSGGGGGAGRGEVLVAGIAMATTALVGGGAYALHQEASGVPRQLEPGITDSVVPGEIGVPANPYELPLDQHGVVVVSVGGLALAAA